jgi:branched-subunit amino acid ABC-type transport system permease component
VTVFLQALISGVVIGAIYAVMTVGLTLVYGSLRTLNMAQGSYVMIGGYAALVLFTQFGWSPWIGLVLAVVVTAILGVATEVFSIRPLVGRKDIDFEMTAYISTLAVTIILSAAALLVFGPQSKTIPPLVGGTLVWGGVTLTWQSIVILVISFVSLAGLSWFLNKTRHGLSVRAVAQELDAARLVGVETKKVYMLTMALAGGLAGIAGVLLAPLYFVNPIAGDLPLVKALIVAILAGLGSIRGTIWAAFMMGLLEALSSTYVGTGWSLTIMFGVIIVVLIIRPNGLFGLQQEERL